MVKYAPHIEPAVLISIRPRWCDMIATERKKMDLRKSRPKIKTPFECYIYMTAGEYAWRKSPWSTAVQPPNGGMYCGSQMVIGEFVCDYIMRQCQMQNADIAELESCVRREDIYKYADGREVFGWHISELKIYSDPKELKDFGIKRAPQSWCYVRRQM